MNDSIEPFLLSLRVTDKIFNIYIDDSIDMFDIRLELFKPYYSPDTECIEYTLCNIIKGGLITEDWRTCRLVNDISVNDSLYIEKRNFKFLENIAEIEDSIENSSWIYIKTDNIAEILADMTSCHTGDVNYPKERTIYNYNLKTWSRSDNRQPTLENGIHAYFINTNNLIAVEKVEMTDSNKKVYSATMVIFKTEGSSIPTTLTFVDPFSNIYNSIMEQLNKIGWVPEMYPVHILDFNLD